MGGGGGGGGGGEKNGFIIKTNKKKKKIQWHGSKRERKRFLICLFVGLFFFRSKL